MKKWMAVTGCILLLSGCAADPEQEKSGIPITNIQVENYFNLGENVQYFSKVPSR
ncbi:MAG: ABC transporter substrate-binding protein, partial [Dialister invisus]|nr:ABC transporter substrate-binding protein [Dialister invisus]